ncbi:uncharacterized protein LOC124312985 isoform X2 [Daphnia pulicaria]|uniref:uncharacterized protein LOC124312985 isoform X2 n=1 Tax=Daphnia pulicaria TaxID=35523 RepID=UPI001EECBF73|nr:uncharacterized protein LOC124312985 isoform X2 [Daphnia pulicaria]
MSQGLDQSGHQSLSVLATKSTRFLKTIMADVNYIHVNLSTGSYLLVEETEATKKKVWEKFLRIVYCDTRKMVTDDNSCRGYAACKVCGQICRLGPKGGTKELEDHFSLCSRAAADNTALRLAEKQLKKENKNQTEKERKDEIKALNKESAYLVIGQESETIPLEEITKARLTRACLSEIPPSIVQFFTDGKSPKDRPMNFYEELQVQLDVLWQRFSEAKNEAYTAYTEAQNGALFTKAIYTVQNATPVQPNLHIGLSYSSANGIDITWVPTDVKSTLDFDRISMIGRNLSELVHPEDYAEIVRVFLTDSSTDGTVKDSKDFTFPDCRLTESIIHRSKTGPEYHTVFLTGYIRQCIRTSREKASQQDKQIMPARTDSSCWPRLASFIHIRTYYQYMTLHSIDGRIIQADKRIKMVAGYTCEEVVNKKAHDFIVEDAVSFVSEAQNNWVYYNGRANCISYPLKGKHRIVHVKSRGEFIYYRDSETNQMIDGFILSNTLIHEDDYQRERSNLQVQWNTSCDTSTTSVEESYNISSSTPEACNTGTPVPMEQDSINDLNETTDFQISLALSPDIYS